MMAAAPGPNASVEEILASIRQAISEDDAKRTNERFRTEVRAMPERRPVARVTGIFHRDQPEDEPATEPAADEASTEPNPDQDAIEHAIEQALDGVRAELEGTRPALPRPLRPPQATEAVATGSAQRAVPRASRMTSIRREAVSPRRALLSPRADAHVSGSFDDLAKAMMGGNARKLDEVVEELLRPMLKGWLEDNLPQMVERMVREEIERVSRGRR